MKNRNILLEIFIFGEIIGGAKKVIRPPNIFIGGATRPLAPPAPTPMNMEFFWSDTAKNLDLPFYDI